MRSLRSVARAFLSNQIHTKSFSSLLGPSSIASLPLEHPTRTIHSHPSPTSEPTDNELGVKGKLTVDHLRTLIENGKIHTVNVMIPDQFGRLMGKRYDGHFFLSQLHNGSHFCTYLLTADLDLNPLRGFGYSSWESGYGDFHASPDLPTLRECAWSPGSAMVMCDIMADTDYVSVAPRSILREQMKVAEDMGYLPMGVAELEYYLFHETFQKANEMEYRNLKPRGHYVEDYHLLQGSRNEDYHSTARRVLKESGIAVESTKGEAGIGQHELNIHYSDLLSAADNAVIMKQCMKELADQKGLSVTFMAKPSAKESGSSCHIHTSLRDLKSNKNVFDGSEILHKNVTSSDTFRWFLGGWIKRMPELMLFLAPTINSYKRFTTGSWAPTRLAWSIDNRTAGFRVVGRGQSLRIENRIPGADCNPYLAMAACVAAGMDGIRNKTEPPPVFNGDIYSASSLPLVPRTLEKAMEIFRASEFAIDSFGIDVVEHYYRHAELEVEKFNECVTDWERIRYFEQI